MRLSRRTLLAGSAAVALSGTARAAGFPDKPIKIVVPYPPGGASDFSARIIAEGMRKRLNQPVIVENRPGAAQMIAMEYTARAAPDGYTLVLASEDATAMMPYLRKSMPYQMPDAFTYVSRVMLSSYLVVVNPDRPYKTIQEFIAYAKANPGQIKYATAGVGTASDITAYVIEMATGIKMNHIPYRGAQSITDTMGGITDASSSSYSSVGEQAKAGKLRFVVATGTTRNPLVPDVPTLTEIGYPTGAMTNWWGVLGPAGIPQDVQKILQDTIVAVQRDPEVKARFEAVGFDATPVTGDDFRKQVIEQMAKWKAFAEKTGLKVDD